MSASGKNQFINSSQHLISFKWLNNPGFRPGGFTRGLFIFCS
jgi:hypothetical protein